MDAPEPAPAETPPQPPAPRDTSKHGRRLSTAQIVQVLALHTDGRNALQISKIIGCHHSTVQLAIDTFSSSTDLAAKFLTGQSLTAARQWARAVRKGAARGRHEPARDLLLHTGAIQPVNTEASGGAKVAVFIGVSSQDPPQLLVQAQSVETPAIEAQAVVVEDVERR